MKDSTLQTLRKLCTGILLAFTLISIGFMLGRNVTEKELSRQDERTNDTYIAVYYLHSTYRCDTCNKIEAITKGVLDRDYKTDIDEGRLHWQEIDFIKNADIAKRFNVAASCVVVAQIEQGKVKDYLRLDEVWTLISDPPALEIYIRDAIDGYLTAGGGR